jgi:hypothetical protein
MLQVFELARILSDQVIPPDRKARERLAGKRHKRAMKSLSC